MRCGTSSGQKKKLWVIKAVDRCTRRTVAWGLGGRDTATFQRLYDKVKPLEDCAFYTDDWDVFAAVLPPERHRIGKQHTVAIERDNSNTRHHLARFTRRTQVVSKLPHRVDITLRIWWAATTTNLFDTLQQLANSIYMNNTLGKGFVENPYPSGRRTDCQSFVCRRRPNSGFVAQVHQKIPSDSERRFSFPEAPRHSPFPLWYFHST
jgi:insertion element IS1 protein InsB